MVISLRIGEEEKRKIEKLAKKNRRSTNSEILCAIDDYLELNKNELKEE